MKQEDQFLFMLESHKGILVKVSRCYCQAERDREDLVQEIIYQLWKSFDNYDARFMQSTWIYRIALNVAISFYRKTGNRPHLPMDEVVFNRAQTDIPQDKEADLALLYKLISGLKDLDKALMLLYLEEKNYREISEILGISESNVGTKISRIKKLLSQKFSKET